MNASDLKLAEALFERSKRFVAQRNFEDACLDLGASFRLFSCHSDERANAVHSAWLDAYTNYQTKDDVAPAVDTSLSKLRKLKGALHKIEERARPIDHLL